MNYTKEEIDSRKVIAIGLATLYTLKGYSHITYSCHIYGADVTVYVDTKEELERAKQDSLMSCVDDCECESQEWDNDAGHYFSYTVKF